MPHLPRTTVRPLHHHLLFARVRTFTTTPRLSANLIPRPKRPYLLDQIVILSDGSAYTQLTTSPRSVVRSTKDVRNNTMWNPSMRELADVEEDEAGKLRKFRDRYGSGFEAAQDGEEGGEGDEGDGDVFGDLFTLDRPAPGMMPGAGGSKAKKGKK